ncbi:MAG: CoA ester lyase [Parvularculaceae bacterium]
MGLRSLLFVPGDRPERHQKAVDAGADAVCIDLEDAVAPDRKDHGRRSTIEFLTRAPAGASVGVRINAISSREGARDAAALAESGVSPAFVMIPKVDGAADIALVQRSIVAPVWSLMETPQAYFALPEIAVAIGEAGGILFGGVDYSASLGSDMSWDALLAARSAVVAAAALSGCATLDVPYLDVRDEAGLIAETKRVKSLGFQGRAAIHPKQVAAINVVFTPSAAEIERAEAVVAACAAAGGGAALLDGKLIEKPVLRAAERVLAARR